MRVFRIAVFVSLFAVRPCQAQESSRYEKWQASRPFTVGARYHEVIHAPPAALPPPSPYPDMDLFRQAGLNLLHDTSHWGGGHDYSAASTAQAAGVPFSMMGLGDWSVDSFQKDVRFFADDPRWSGFCGVGLTNEAHGAPLAEFRKERDWLLETYPHLLTFVCDNLCSNDAGKFRWQKCIEAIRPDVFYSQFAPYHTMDGGLPDISTGVPAWALPRSIAGPGVLASSLSAK